MNTQLASAYAVCRGITRRAAKNFHYAFLALPREKRDALCAVYAFMRHADDISDHPSLRLEEKYTRLAGWRDHMHYAVEGHRTDEPVLLALSDAQARFRIPVELLDNLIEGTAMDLETPPAVPIDGSRLSARYATFDELYRYCYHVASVVGLVTIRVFGYRDPAAEPLAERCGIAFQLTNILRDVKEDASMGRVYLPAEDLARYGRSAAELDPQALANGFDPAGFRPVLELQAERAREFYRSAEELLPLIDEDSQPALWVLVEIYRRLLGRIAARGYDVFGERIRLSATEKLGVLGRGLLRRVTG
ncbi:MAG: phytoene/squalene synthase family protein [Acidobacteria bacterium]|nr:phytoene/squalene synthase family protein [Acidobacteriota bacterium]